MDTKRLACLARFTSDLATLSKCTDKHVAAIITNAVGSQVLSIGVNGGPAGGSDCLCGSGGGKYTCAHAEMQALAKCKESCEHAVMICTLSPCVTCATLIVNSGIVEFYYIDKYKNDDGLSILEADGIICKQIKEVV